MPACDFVQIASICITQSAGTSGAFVAGIASLTATIAKIWYDRGAEKRLSAFKQQEQRSRDEFEKKQAADIDARQTQFAREEREARQNFESTERQARERYQDHQARDTDERQADLKQELEDYVRQSKWKDERRTEKLMRLRAIADHLNETYSGVDDLVREGPIYGDLKMIVKTAPVLESFAKFNRDVSSFLLGVPFAEHGKHLAEHVTKILLTLSPSQAVRNSQERKDLLHQLMEQLLDKKSAFERLCNLFENDPDEFDRCFVTQQVVQPDDLAPGESEA